MKEPETEQELKILNDILHADPSRFIQIVDKWIEEKPGNSDALFSRHQGWMRLGKPLEALDDLNKVIGIEPDVTAVLSRGEVYRHLGDHRKALEDFARAEAIDPMDWETGIVVGLLLQADSYGKLGDEAAALSCCARLPDDFWTPGLGGAPSGNKTEVAAKLRAVAASARRGQT